MWIEMCGCIGLIYTSLHARANATVRRAEGAMATRVGRGGGVHGEREGSELLYMWGMREEVWSK